MSTVLGGPPAFKSLTESLSRDGWCLSPGFFSRELTGRLRDEAVRLRDNDGFLPATVGQGAQRHLDPDTRSDLIRWLEPPFSAAQQEYLGKMEHLRQSINQTLFLGLLDYECHLSLYPPGARYRRHLDQFRRVSRRTVSCVAYLNEAWLPEYGGPLRLHGANKEEAAYHDIFPIGGTLVCFLSNRIPHEVLPATHERFSVTGWFRVRG